MSFFDLLRGLGRRRKAIADRAAADAPRGASPTAFGVSEVGRSSDLRGVDIDSSERRLKPRKQMPAGTRVLIVDDSKTIVAALRRMLRENNCVTLDAYDAESALEILRTERPDLVFLDIILPGMHGFEALRRIRRMPEVKDVPIIVMSANESAAEQFYAEQIGANDFMKKPFSRAEVFVRMERALGLV